VFGDEHAKDADLDCRAIGPLRVAIVAGEASGDLLAADLMAALRSRVGEVHFEGVGGPRMAQAGCRILAPSEKLAVMGITEVLGHLPSLLALRRDLKRHFVATRPDIFIGVDAPDFNLGLERALRRAGITTAHYVSPSVWAWRSYRVRKIARSVDLMLTLFPFEAAFYRQHQVPVHFVGHPLADAIPLDARPDQARQRLALPQEGAVVALLPGSRVSEVTRLAAAFLATARWCATRHPGLRFLMPAATPSILQYLMDLAEREPVPGLRVLEGQSHLAIEAADAVLVASGTATLECLLYEKPMVVAYRLAPLTYWMAKRLLRVPYFSLPNLLVGERLVAEFVQEQAAAEYLGPAMCAYLESPSLGRALSSRFREVHVALSGGASARAADALVALLARRKRQSAEPESGGTGQTLL
jgi:lipid-A-disaccharide synthase